MTLSPDWKAPPFPPAKVLDGRYCRLEPIDPDRHLDDIWAANGGHDHIWTWMPALPPKDREGYRELLAMMAGKPGIVPFAVIDKADGKAKGHLWLMEIRPENGVFEVGYIFAEPAAHAGRDRGDLPLRRLWLLARLSPLRMEVQQPQRAVEARRFAFRLPV
jgi:hypothetical protein